MAVKYFCDWCEADVDSPDGLHKKTWPNTAFPDDYICAACKEDDSAQRKAIERLINSFRAAALAKGETDER